MNAEKHAMVILGHDIGRRLYKTGRSRKKLVRAATTPASAPWSAPGTATHLTASSASITSTPATCTIATIAPIGITIAATIASISIGVVVAPSASLSTITLSPPATSAHLLLRRHLLNLHSVLIIDCRLTLLHQLLCCVLPGKGDEGKGLGLVVLHLVNRPDNLHNTPKLLKVGLQVLFGEGLPWGQLAHVDLALTRLSFLARHLLALYNMGGLSESSLYACQLLEDDECKAPRPASHGIHLQVDVLDVTKGSKVLFDIGVLRLLWESPDKELPVIFMDNIASVSHGSVLSLFGFTNKEDLARCGVREEICRQLGSQDG